MQLILTEIRHGSHSRPSSEQIMDMMDKLGCSASEAEHALVVQSELHRLEKLRFDTLSAINIMTQKVQRLDTSTLVFDYGTSSSSSGINPVAFSPYINKVNPNKRNKDVMLASSHSVGSAAEEGSKKLSAASLNASDPMEEESKRRKKETSVSLGKRVRDSPAVSLHGGAMDIEDGDVMIENVDPSTKKTRFQTDGVA